MPSRILVPSSFRPGLSSPGPHILTAYRKKV
jgi:hypothetical protein